MTHFKIIRVFSRVHVNHFIFLISICISLCLFGHCQVSKMQHVQSCIICQQCKRQNCPPKAPLHPLEPVDVWERWSLDFGGPLPVSDSGYKYLLMIVESLSGYPEIIPVKDQTAKTAADCLYEYVFARHGAPKYLVSDRGAAFLSQVMGQLCSRFGVKRLFTSAYHPKVTRKRSDGGL